MIFLIIKVATDWMHSVDHNGKLIEECITISSAWSQAVAFRISPSKPELFEVSTTAGYLQPFQSLRIPLSSSKKISPDDFQATITVDIAIAEEEDQEEFSSAELFWERSHVKSSSRIISCECARKGDVEDEDTFAESSVNNASSSRPPKIHPPRGHILDLMVKNVSKDDPLNHEEKEVSRNCFSCRHKKINLVYRN